MSSKLNIAIVTILMVAASSVVAKEPGWTTRVIKRGEDRKQSDATHILLRPYRPFHFYGNTVRRQYYRGNPLPTVRDVRSTIRYVTVE